MNRRIGAALVIALLAIVAVPVSAQGESVVAANEVIQAAAKFTAPVRLKDGEAFIRIEEPGYASPCWADVTGDGKKDLLVGQFAGGKIKIYPGLGNGKIGKGEWLEVDGKTAEVPGVW